MAFCWDLDVQSIVYHYSFLALSDFCNAACSDLGLPHMNIATQFLYLIPPCQTLLPLFMCNWVVSSTEAVQIEAVNSEAKHVGYVANDDQQ